MRTRLLEAFPDQADLLSLEPEELAFVLIGEVRRLQQSAGFTFSDVEQEFFPPWQGGPQRPGYPQHTNSQVCIALAEALSALETQGLIVRNPNQPSANWYLVTRRGLTLRSSADIDAYRQGRTLPLDLLPQGLTDKVYPLYLRGDHDTAVFQAFKEVEVAVRRAGGYGDGLVGRDLMHKAFHPETGPLRDKALIAPERESEMFLFSGAIGHAKNPPGHRDVGMSRATAARLIVFAAHLLGIVEERGQDAN
jgi:hypothetical protein